MNGALASRLSGSLSLRTRILLVTGLLLFGVAALIFHVSMMKIAADLHSHLLSDSERSLTILEQSIAEQAITSDYAAIQQILTARANLDDVKRVIFRDSSGRMIKGASQEVDEQRPQWFSNWVELDPPPKTRQIVVGGASYGSVTLVMDAERLENDLWRLFVMLGSLTLGSVALLLLLIARLLKSNLRLLTSLQQAAQSFRLGDYSARVAFTSTNPPELRQTAQAFNDMGARSGALLKALSEQRRAMDNAAIVAETDLAGNITYANDKFCEISGYSREEIIGQNYHLINCGCHEKALSEKFWVTIVHGNVWHGEIRNRTKGGESYWVDTVITPILGDQDLPQKYIAVSIDITQRKRHETMLERREAWLAEFAAITSGGSSRTERIDQLLQLGCRQMGMEIGMAGKVEGNDYHVIHAYPGDTPFKAGDILPLDRTYCSQVIHTDAVLQFAEPAAAPAGPAQPIIPLQAFVGVPLHVNDRLYGVLSFSSTSSRAPFDRDELGLAQLCADWLGLAIANSEQEAVIYAEKELAEVTLASIGDAVITTDAAGRVTYLNQVAENLTGWRNAEAQGQPISTTLILIDEESREAVNNPVETALREQRVTGLTNHTVLVRRDGVEFSVENSAAPIRDHEGNIVGAVLVFHDVSDKRRLLKQISWQAGHDTLTGLPNRALLSDRLSQAIASARRHERLLAVLFLDLDGFKAINDTFGHNSGDELLREIARRLTHAVRNVDTVARLGGDEFVILLVDIPEVGEIEKTLQRIMNVVSAPVAIGEDEPLVTVSASIGVTVYPLNDADADSLLRHADIAMYQSKQAGRNQFKFFDVEMDRETRSHHEQHERIARALRQREFVLHYQPKVNMRTGEVLGLEALIRWQDPERGLRAPGEFLPVAEGSDLIVAIGNWVLEEALAQMERWQVQGTPIKVSVNIAARQIQHDGFMPELNRALDRHHAVSPAQLELEILETAALDDIKAVQAVMAKCSEMGVRFSLDDFGTGYSSLTYLKRLPVNALKIDQSFVRDMLEDREDMAIIQGVVSMSRIFNREVIAEGVENAAQGARLLHLGCECAQGYGIARPMPADEVPHWLATWRPDSSWVH